MLTVVQITPGGSTAGGPCAARCTDCL